MNMERNFVTKAAFLILALGSMFLNNPSYAQGTAEDYKRAEGIDKIIQDNIYNSVTNVQWINNESRFAYTINSSKGKEFLLVDASNQTKELAFDHVRLAEALAKASGETVDATKLPFSSIKYGANKNTVEFSAFGKSWTCNLGTYDISQDKTIRSRGSQYWGERPKEPTHHKVGSPDSLWVAFIKNSNVFIQSKTDSKIEHQLSYDGSEGEFYSSNIVWSPNSQHLVAVKIKPAKDRTLYLLESSPSDQLQPKIQTRDYLKPGDALTQRHPSMFSLSNKEQVQIPPAIIVDQFSISMPKWWDDSRGFSFEYNQRGHQSYQIIEMNAETGKARALIDESSKTFIDYSGKKYRHDINDGREIIWASERDGWNHLYLYDGLSGKVKNQITKGEWVVRKVIHVDEKNRNLIFEGSGKEKGQDPYFVQYYRVNFDGSGLTALTKENANHSAVFSPDYNYFVDTYSRIDQPSVTVLRYVKDGNIIMELEKADISSLMATGWKMPEVFSAKGRDGKTDIWGMIIRPTNFDPSKKYPIIEYIYAGPHSSFVPKSFSGNPSGVAALAELGFIVVQIDGMGTSNRSKAFHDVCYQNLKDAGFPDRILWMKSAASKYPYMDLNRVGIYGTSAGGQSSAGAVLFHPEFYKVAVSSCGCHDNRMDKIWWNEQWMGKLGDHYAASSNTVNAAKLKGKLMLIVGELDDNVDPASTYQFVDALIKAKKDFEFIMIPGMGHSSGGEYGERKRRDYFVKHLLGVEPPLWDGQNSIF